MKQLVSEILRLAEIEIPRYRDKLAELTNDLDEYKRELVVRPRYMDTPDYTAIDSGYAVVQYRYLNIASIVVVIIDKYIKTETILFSFKRNEKIDLNNYIRKQELMRAERYGGYVLSDGPISPYLREPRGFVIGVSKDPVAPRYWRGVGGRAGEWFKEISGYVSELYGAEILLRGEPPGSMLRPVKLGRYLVTYIKGDSVFYVEFPEYIPQEVVSSFFRYGYPIKLRIAHRYAKITREYLRTVKTIAPRLLDISIKYREYL
ncbi:MAG: nuclease NurA [Thermoproteus sp. JCHS_4]|jgi:NurA domain.|nr:MAG: nuclease NurA [Thermoproteus sp. JCHS_4]